MSTVHPFAYLDPWLKFTNVCCRLVEIAMEAMDLLLMACHAQTLNLFVESFLRMVQKLLEDSNPNLQIMATNSVRDGTVYRNTH